MIRGRLADATAGQIERYQSRISGPLLDRLDLFVDVPRLTREELRGEEPAEASTIIRDRVGGARRVQTERQGVYRTPRSPDAPCGRSADCTATRRDYSPRP